MPTVTAIAPAGRLTVLCSSVEEMSLVAVFAPATSSCEAETKPEPRMSNKKLVPSAIWVTEPEAKIGSGLSTLTLSEAEDAGADSVVAVIVIEWPAQIVDAGEYLPAGDIGPVESLPPAMSLTDHTTGVVAPPSEAVYCALPPSLTVDGPPRATCIGVCACVTLLQIKRRNANVATKCRLMR
jgi:hypothetical protein